MKTQYLLMRETETADLIPVGTFDKAEVRDVVKSFLVTFGGYDEGNFKEYEVQSWDGMSVLEMLGVRGITLPRPLVATGE